MVSRSVEVDMKLDSLKNCVDELYERFDQIDVELKRLNESLNILKNRLDNTLTSMSYSDEKVLGVESYFGVLKQRIDNIESYRDFKEKRYEELKQKVGIIISATLISIFVFSIGYCCGVLQWK